MPILFQLEKLLKLSNNPEMAYSRGLADMDCHGLSWKFGNLESAHDFANVVFKSGQYAIYCIQKCSFSNCLEIIPHIYLKPPNPIRKVESSNPSLKEAYHTIEII